MKYEEFMKAAESLRPIMEKIEKFSYQIESMCSECPLRLKIYSGQDDAKKVFKVLGVKEWKCTITTHANHCTIRYEGEILGIQVIVFA